ncbi:aminodeoxychorismate lyase [Shewanella inventionis]|uniref:Aminodeoxychorismate lyase n=1 Tax=Shewanella inventionis TaxID=1738770 RepID=A0ABQ1IR67_9GAMM|nr:aminodeoxychorismate lyase [Shewanella inventionis]MCL1157171.1 aminodeoxychorismate lyase [Shewanella inventionis]UAL41969.1 aminodeoxychorismate lyase [Shewanella inventionis]GGB49282.1 4-amino-4-deoxychorismate lyase [Shewanella inventionis]
MTSVWVNHVEQGRISPFDRGLAYGDGVFATMRTACAHQTAAVLYMDLHLQRLQQSSQRLGIQWQANDLLIDQLLSLAKAYPDHCIKLVLTRGEGGRGYQAPDIAKLTEVVSVHPIPSHYAQWQQQGISLATSPIRLARQPLLAGMKHLNRLEQVLIKTQPLIANTQDWLVLDTDGWVIESSMANIFAIKEGQIFTPAMTHAGVSGVMREQMIDQLLTAGFAVTTKPLRYEDICSADHIFITNSLFGVVDVNTIDQFQFSRWTLTSRFRQVLSVDLP